MDVSYGIAETLQKTDILHLHAYRYAVFVKRLGWRLPDARDGLDIDQFDRADTIHVIARNDDGALCGCARLLPTNRPYLLDEVFPDLMHGTPAPKSENVWELSRFSSTSLTPTPYPPPAWVGREVMSAAVACAIEVGATKLIAVSAIGIKRFLCRLGINWYPVGPTIVIGGHAIFALCIEIDEKTLTALNLLGATKELCFA